MVRFITCRISHSVAPLYCCNAMLWFDIAMRYCYRWSHIASPRALGKSSLRGYYDAISAVDLRSSIWQMIVILDGPLARRLPALKSSFLSPAACHVSTSVWNQVEPLQCYLLPEARPKYCLPHNSNPSLFYFITPSSSTMLSPPFGSMQCNIGSWSRPLIYALDQRFTLFCLYRYHISLKAKAC